MPIQSRGHVDKHRSLIISAVAVAAIGLLVVMVNRKETRLPTTKTCPDCRSDVPIEARVCRYCGFAIPQVIGPETGNLPEPQPSRGQVPGRYLTLTTVFGFDGEPLTATVPL